MKKLLLIIPLLIWVACEDDKQEQNEEENGGSNTPFIFSEGFIKHRTTSITSNNEDGTY